VVVAHSACHHNCLASLGAMVRRLQRNTASLEKAKLPVHISVFRKKERIFSFSGKQNSESDKEK